jgi:plasmid stability protein
MRRVPTLHLRNVPPKLYESLQRRAKRNGRSMNAEALVLLEDAVERDRRATSVTEELRRRGREIKRPAGAPPPEQVIRELRDARPRGL